MYTNANLTGLGNLNILFNYVCDMIDQYEQSIIFLPCTEPRKLQKEEIYEDQLPGMPQLPLT